MPVNGQWLMLDDSLESDDPLEDQSAWKISFSKSDFPVSVEATASLFQALSSAQRTTVDVAIFILDSICFEYKIPRNRKKLNYVLG